MIIPSELPDTIRWETVPSGGCEYVVGADPRALDALAIRMGIPAVLAFTCHFSLRRGPLGSRTVSAAGHLRAKVVLTCVVSLESFEAVLDEPFEIRFVPLDSLQEQPDPDEIDEVPYEDGVLALGETAAEQLALLLPAFPRRPGVETSEEAAFLGGDDRESGTTPFAVLGSRNKPI